MDRAAGFALAAALLLAAPALPGQAVPDAASQSGVAHEGTAEPPRAAEAARLAARGLLIAIAPAGQRLVAVGDRGIIVLSDDRGASWRQADYVPAQALLTGVCFLDGQHGVAVGHDELILTTDDAGRRWKLAHYAPQAQRPLLDVWCGPSGEVIAVGAYSAYFVSADGGASWRDAKFTPTAAAPHDRHAPAASRAPSPGVGNEEGAGGGYHLNRIVAGDGRRLYIAGEAGHLYASDDGGGSWRTLGSPYEGSFFGLLPLPGQALLAFGLRGHLYRSADAGASWQAIETGTVAMLTGAASLGCQARETGDVAKPTLAAPSDCSVMVIVGLSGALLVSRDGGRTFALLQQADRSGLSAAVAVGGERLAVVGEAGARLISVGNQTGGGSTSP